MTPHTRTTPLSQRFQAVLAQARILSLSFAVACLGLSAGTADAAKRKPAKKPVATAPVGASTAKRAQTRVPATLVMNADTGEEYLDFQAERLINPASTQKMLTAYIVFKAISEGRLTRESELTVSRNAAYQDRTNLALRKEWTCVRGHTKKKKKRTPIYGRCTGEQIVFKLTVDRTLRGLMTHSANDGAVVLAEALGGSVSGFAKLMNETAKELGMTDSHFVNPNGFGDPFQYTTARDMARLLAAVQRDYPDLYREYFSVPSVTLFNGETKANTNKLLHSADCPGVTGGKTGFIKAAGSNLVVMAERNGHHIVVSAFGRTGAAERNKYVCNLINYAFYKIAQDPAATFDTTRTYPVVSPQPQIPPPLVPLPVLHGVTAPVPR